MKLIKEALDEKKKSLNEDYGWEVKSGKEFDLLELLKDNFGAERILQDLAQALERDELAKNLAYICRQYDFGNEYIVGYEEEKEESLTEDYETKIDWEGGVQEITRGDYYNFLDSVQPIYWTRVNNTVEPGTETPEYSEVFLAGGAFDYDEEKKKNLYAKFGRKDGKYYYLGLDYVEKVK